MYLVIKLGKYLHIYIIDLMEQRNDSLMTYNSCPKGGGGGGINRRKGQVKKEKIWDVCTVL